MTLLLLFVLIAAVLSQLRLQHIRQKIYYRLRDIRESGTEPQKMALRQELLEDLSPIDSIELDELMLKEEMDTDDQISWFILETNLYIATRNISLVFLVFSLII